MSKGILTVDPIVVASGQTLKRYYDVRCSYKSRTATLVKKRMVKNVIALRGHGVCIPHFVP